jgi:hypothetical protein
MRRATKVRATRFFASLRENAGGVNAPTDLREGILDDVICPGALIVHADGTIVGCTLDEDEDGCRGRELRHEGDPVPCILWTPSGCNYCGVQL